MVSGITPCAQECKWIDYFGEPPRTVRLLTVAIKLSELLIVAYRDVYSGINATAIYRTTLSGWGDVGAAIPCRVPPACGYLPD